VPSSRRKLLAKGAHRESVVLGIEPVRPIRDVDTLDAYVLCRDRHGLRGAPYRPCQLLVHGCPLTPRRNERVVESPRGPELRIPHGGRAEDADRLL
jgi:hypothetical protein